METRDLIRLSGGALTGHPLRSVLSMLGIAIGVAAVVLLTSLGEGARRYVVAQFMQFGTNVIAINPGKVETMGLPTALGAAARKLTIADAEAIDRLPVVKDVVAMAMGQARVEGNGRGRSVLVYGSTANLPEVFSFAMGQGQYLPAGDPRRASNVTVLGPKLKRELFGDANALGAFVRVAGAKLRVIGVMAPKGRMLGFDIDDAAYVPVATAMQLFNLQELTEIDLTFAHEGLTDEVADAVSALLIERHGGNEDFTLTKQTEMLQVFGRIMDVITMSVGVIAGISLLVGAVGIFTMMWISVGERIAEIGLMRAIGATAAQVHLLFIAEALLLSLVGALAGLGIGLALALVIRAMLPGMPLHTPMTYLFAAVLMSVATGLVSGVGPARRASRLEPVDALRAE